MSRAMIGLEIHLYLRTRSKLFCGCDADFLAAPAPNANVCPVCTGQPGSKPRAPNAAAFEAALRVAQALGADITRQVRFQRKHYFYPDSPANYQRTAEPLATGGALGGVPLWEMHVEEDPGAYDPASGAVDYNRAGAPLLEIVTSPGFASAAHARSALNELRLVVAYLDVGRWDAGLKADCNVSIDGGARVEVKNVNSVRNVERALAYEIERQSREGAVRETRHFDEDNGTTRAMRAKEAEADYRFLADPDLAPIDLAPLARAPEERPFARRARMAAVAGVADEDASPLLEERALADAFESIAARAAPRSAFDFVVRDLRGELGFRAKSLAQSGLAHAALADLVAGVESKRVTAHTATRLLRASLDGPTPLAALLAAELGQTQPEEDAVALAARATLAEEPRAVADYRAGKTATLNYLVGKTMRKLQGRAQPDAVRAAVEAALREA